MSKIWISLCVLASIYITHVHAQRNAAFGDVHTPKGDLHMLVIFIRYDNANLMRASKSWLDETAEGVLPDMAKGDVNALFHKDPESLSEARNVFNISDFYYTMSGGRFRITADIFPVQVPVKYVSERRGNFFRRQGQMNQAAINWIAENYPDFNWGKYDNRTNMPKYRFDNSESPPDSVLDYVIFMHRAPGSTGMGASSNLKIPHSPYKILNGHTGIRSYADPEHNWEYFKHEFAHNLYSCPHYLGANGADGDKYYTQKGWGLMAAWHSPFFTANAWESWWLGWLEPQEIKEDGRYRIKDFVTGRDAIRIRIPGTSDYLWIENHQKIDQWDDKIFFKDSTKNEPQSAKGIYMYVVAKPGSDKASPRLNPFNRKHANLIKMLNAEGNFDYHATGDSLHTGYFLCPLVENGRPNPVAGQNAFQFIRVDYNRDDKIRVGMAHGNSDKGGGEQQDIWTEVRNGKAVYSLSSTGNEDDAFQTGDWVGLSGSQPIVNYPIYRKDQQKLNPYVLSGIQVRVLDQEADGSYMLDIQLDNWTFNNEQRWSGNILIPSGQDSPELILDKGADLLIDLSGTSERTSLHPLTGTFANPTYVALDSGRALIIRDNARLTIDAFSELNLHPYSKIVIEKGGRLNVATGGKLSCQDQGQIVIEKGGKLLIEKGGTLALTSENDIQRKRRRDLKIKGQTLIIQP